MENIDIIFFDIGGVLMGGEDIRVRLRKAAAELDLPEDLMRSVEGNHWVPFALGMTSEQEYWEGIKKDLQLGDELDRIKDETYDLFVPLQDTLDLAVELSEKYRIGIISNHSNEWSDYLLETFNFREYFEPIIISSRVGMRKPGLGIYEAALAEAGVPAERALFIDDKVSNIEAAKRIGMHGIVFESPEQLREALESYLT